MDDAALLSQIPALEALSAEELNEILDFTTQKEFLPGQDIITEGDRGASMYVMKSGVAVCTKIGINNGAVLREYVEAEFFGELALLKKESRAATITAKLESEPGVPAPPCVVIEITKKAYEKVLMNEDAQDKMLEADQGYAHYNMLRELFQEIDEDGGGSLDREEITHLAEKLGIDLTPTELDEAFVQMDPDGSGEVEFEEFREWFDKQTGADKGKSKFGGALRNRGASMEDPFFHACVSGNIANVSRLSEKNEQDPHKLRHRWDTPGGSWIRSDVTPLWAACYCGHLLVVKFLIAECGTDATIVTRDMKETPFWVACFKGHRAIVEYLVEAANERGFLDHGIHGTTVDGWTPLFGACYMGHLDVIKYLCEELEVNPLQVNGLGQSPYWVSCARGQLQVVQYLALECKVDTDRASYGGISPLTAAQSGDRRETVEWLTTGLARVRAEEAQMTAEEIRVAHEKMFGASARRAVAPSRKMTSPKAVLAGGKRGLS